MLSIHPVTMHAIAPTVSRTCRPFHLGRRTTPRRTFVRGLFRDAYERPEVNVPFVFNGFCFVCGTGVGIQQCPACDGDGVVMTKPGGAGVRGKIGLAKCQHCLGMGKVPCPICGGRVEVSRPPRDPRLDFEKD